MSFILRAAQGSDSDAVSAAIAGWEAGVKPDDDGPGVDRVGSVRELGDV